MSNLGITCGYNYSPPKTNTTRYWICTFYFLLSHVSKRMSLVHTHANKVLRSVMKSHWLCLPTVWIWGRLLPQVNACTLTHTLPCTLAVVPSHIPIIEESLKSNSIPLLWVCYIHLALVFTWPTMACRPQYKAPSLVHFAPLLLSSLSRNSRMSGWLHLTFALMPSVSPTCLPARLHISTAQLHVPRTVSDTQAPTRECFS